MTQIDGDFRETVLEHLDGNDYFLLTTSEKKWKNKAEKILSDPAVKLVARNEDGSVCVKIPKAWIKISKPKQMNLTDEQRQATAERFRQIRERKQAT